MGTRSTTTVYEGETPILRLYCQFDGYLDGVGEQLSEFVQSAPFVNGLRDNSPAFNGMGCFAAQLVAHMKKKPGLWYVAPMDSEDQEYNYVIRGGLDESHRPIPVRVGVSHYGESFEGSAEEFAQYIKSNA